MAKTEENLSQNYITSDSGVKVEAINRLADPDD